MNVKTAHAVMSLHRKQMVAALTNKGKEDMLGFYYAAFQHRKMMKEYAPAMYALWVRQNPKMAANDELSFKNVLDRPIARKSQLGER